MEESVARLVLRLASRKEMAKLSGLEWGLESDWASESQWGRGLQKEKGSLFLPHERSKQ